MNLKSPFVIPSDALCLYYVLWQQVPVYHHLELHLVSCFSQFRTVWISEQQFPTFHIVIFKNAVRSPPLTYSVPLHHEKSLSLLFPPTPSLSDYSSIPALKQLQGKGLSYLLQRSPLGKIKKKKKIRKIY